jgi:hypothetical protein
MALFIVVLPRTCVIEFHCTSLLLRVLRQRLIEPLKSVIPANAGIQTFHILAGGKSGSPLSWG